MTEQEKQMAEIIALHIVREKHLTDMIEELLNNGYCIHSELKAQAKELLG